jgi:uncharacterized protein
MLAAFIRPDTPLAVFWLFVGIAILIQGISKSGFAGGAAILSVPLMILVMPVDKVAATMLPLLILCDFNAIYFYWNDKIWKKVLEMYIPAVIGILLGAAVWWWMGREGIQAYEGYLKRFIGAIAILFALYILGKEAAMAWVEQFTFGPGLAWPMGIAAGFCSTIAHAAGPIVGLYMFAQGLGKTLFVGCTAWIFTLINLTKLPFYIAVGLVKTDVLLFDLFLIGLVPIGSYLGKWMHGRVSERLFNRVILTLTLVAGLQLVFNVEIVQALYRALFRFR